MCIRDSLHRAFDRDAVWSLGRRRFSRFQEVHRESHLLIGFFGQEPELRHATAFFDRAKTPFENQAQRGAVDVEIPEAERIETPVSAKGPTVAKTH